MARKKSTTPNKPFDATTKSLVEVNPKGWLDFLGLPATTYELVSADLSTVTTEADRLIRVTTPVEYGVHQEFQAGAESRFPDRCLRYNVLPVTFPAPHRRASFNRWKRALSRKRRPILPASSGPRPLF